ncbi:MAG: S-adenosyl-l-methionine hydroxide adenosyltransferase family protein [Chitinophagaceae bacterium]|nr:S-adenosyl-l-methionine hydroxide adenosyltransferase family protein [Chitinophagaceae bacterium]
MKYFSFIFLIAVTFFSCSADNTPAIVIQTDFGLKDGAVAEMKGVIFKETPYTRVFDLTHEIPVYNIWEAAYRLQQTAPYWPAGTIFISVVDPGVGTQRKGVVLKTKNGYYFVTPDNGTLTLIAESMGVASLRQIDEKLHRREGSSGSYTFHGRDIFAYTAAELASGKIAFEQVGPELPPKVVKIPYQKPVFSNGKIKGNIPVLDPQYGNVWTNIDTAVFNTLNVKHGDTLNVEITHLDTLIYAGKIPYVKSFGDVAEEAPLAYQNSLMNFALAINMGNFASRFRISNGADWNIAVRK